MTRARRRHDLERMKAKARRVFPRDSQAKWANHLQGCSCNGCCNERRCKWNTMWERMTMQERRFACEEVAP